MQHSRYIYTSSRYCKDLFPQNFAGEINLQLGQPIHLEGKWSCGLVEFVLNNAPQEPVYVCCDLVHESTTGDFAIPILRQVSHKTSEFERVLYVPLKERDFQTVRVYVRTRENRPLPQAPNINQGNSSATLHFKRHVNEDNVDD